MNRKVNLISGDNQKIDGLDNIYIQEINNIYPYSCELLVCKYFNIFEQSDVEKAMIALVDKIRPQGQLIVGLIDLHKICNDLINKQLTNKDFFDFIRNIHNSFSLDDMIEYVNKTENINILDINYSQQYIVFITLSKNS